MPRLVACLAQRPVGTLVTLALVMLSAAASAARLPLGRSRGPPILLSSLLLPSTIAEVREIGLATLLHRHRRRHHLLSHLLHTPLIFHRLVCGVVVQQSLLCSPGMLGREVDAGFGAGKHCPCLSSLSLCVAMPGRLRTAKNL